MFAYFHFENKFHINLCQKLKDKYLDSRKTSEHFHQTLCIYFFNPFPKRKHNCCFKYLSNSLDEK